MLRLPFIVFFQFQHDVEEILLRKEHGMEEMNLVSSTDDGTQV